MPPGLVTALQNPVPFIEPHYPAALQELFCALHIDPPHFATPEEGETAPTNVPCITTPEEGEDIASTPPLSPKMQINHMDLCTTPDDVIYTPDNVTRTHAQAQTMHETVYIPQKKSMNVHIFLHLLYVKNVLNHLHYSTQERRRTSCC